MAMVSVLQPRFGLVCAVGVGSVVVHNVWMNMKVNAARKKYGVALPTLYADASHKNAKTFNCIQRAHQQSLENLPSFLSLLILSGLQYPVTAAASGVVYLLGRILYFNGYSTGDPDKKKQGIIGYVGYLALLCTLGKTSFDLMSAM